MARLSNAKKLEEYPDLTEKQMKETGSPETDRQYRALSLEGRRRAKFLKRVKNGEADTGDLQEEREWNQDMLLALGRRVEEIGNGWESSGERVALFVRIDRVWKYDRKLKGMK